MMAACSQELTSGAECDQDFPGAAREVETGPARHHAIHQGGIRTLRVLDRAADPSEIGPVIAFAASARNTYMTGANINVDGGSDFA